jgi:RNA methyltransferase, TrmH family
MIEVITSLKNPRVQEAVKLRERRQRDRSNRFLIEGYRELRRAVDAHVPMIEIYSCPDLYLGVNERQLLIDAQIHCNADVIEVNAPVFAKMAYRERPEGLLAVATIPEWSLDTLDERSQSRRAARTGSGELTNALYVVAVGIEKPGNLGTMLRTADAVGADGVIVCDRCTDVFNPNVVRASTGTLFTVPIAEATTDELLLWLKARNIRSVATTPDTNLLHSDATLTGPLAVLVGTEQLGLSDQWLSASDVKVRIPMLGTADSLNAAIATAVVLYEAIRQRSSDNQLGH